MKQSRCTFAERFTVCHLIPIGHVEVAMPGHIFYKSVHCSCCGLTDQSDGCLIQVHTLKEAGVIQSIKKRRDHHRDPKRSCCIEIEEIVSLYCVAQASSRRYLRPGSFSKVSAPERNPTCLGSSKPRTKNCRSIVVTTQNPPAGVLRAMASLQKAATHCKQVAAWLSFHASL